MLQGLQLEFHYKPPHIDIRNNSHKIQYSQISTSMFNGTTKQATIQYKEKVKKH
jgi:hypothetical protein